MATASGGALITTWRWIDTITKQLELCNAIVGETAVVLATDTSDPAMRSLVALSLERLGCRVSEIIVRSGSVLEDGDPVDNEAVAAALLHSDLVVDLGNNLVERSSAKDEILDEARVLAIDVQSTADLDHLVAHPGLAKRLGSAVGLVDTATELKVTSAAGTSLLVELANAKPRAFSGAASKVGDLAHWPSGNVWIDTTDAHLGGSVVAMPGDLITNAAHVLRSPVRVEVQNGRVVEVLGDTADADVLRSYLESFNDESAYQVTAIGWGMNLTRRVHELSLFDPAWLATGRGTLAAGRVNLRTGHPDSGHHSGVTLSLAGASITVDNNHMVLNGHLDGTLAPDIYERAASS